MDKTIRPRRSVLYVPGGNARMQEKARGVAADSIVIDLEDSVAPEAKPDARALTVATVRAGGFGAREVAIRINPPGSAWFDDDLLAAAEAAPDAILITKVQAPAEILGAEARLDALGTPEKVALWAMIETPRGILDARAIADLAATGKSRRLAGFVLGTNDIAKETRARPGRARAPLLPVLTMAVLAARAADLFVLDGVFNDFSDAAGFEAECAQGRDFGMDGKTLIHPSQIDTANRVFSPSAEEIAEARAIIDAFALPENAGKGAIRLQGRMVELLHADIAARTLAIAAAVAGR
jgi:citrate lyase subunit beta/citryl-CoA lyase